MPKTGPNANTFGQTMMPTPSFDLQPVIAANQRGMKAVAEAQEHLFSRAVKMNEEIHRFVSRRLEHDRSTMQQLSTCKSPQEAFAVWGTFMEKATQQYSEGIGLLAELYADQAREAMEEVQHEVEESILPVMKTGGKT
ncbi:MAG: hypothetical protein Kilf2KO_30230 [Rhodospirillales bacterium]